MFRHLTSNEFSPWQRGWLVEHVPPDIWREIFKLHHAEKILAFPAGGADSVVFPALFLCQICSKWREVATNAPELWNRVSLYICDSGQLRPHPKLLSLVLDRAGSVPLKISLDGIMKRRKKFAEIRDTVRLLLKNFHRAAEIDINTDIFTLPKLLSDPPLESIVAAEMPLLQNLVLRSGPAKFTIDPKISQIWTTAPNLRRIVFDQSTNFDFPYLLDALQIPFGQLTSVTIGPAISTRCLYELLSRYKSLVECVVGDLEWDNEFHSNRILLPALQHLSIRILDPDFHLGQEFLAYLKTPALTTLDLEDSGDEGWSHDDFASFLRNSSCSIQHLGLNILPFTSDARLKSLQLLSELTSLRLRFCDAYPFTYNIGTFNEIVVSELGKWDESRKEFSLLPRLEKIIVDYKVIPNPNGSAMFADMVEDRRIAVKVVKVKEPDSQIPSWIQQPYSKPSGLWSSCALLRLLVLKHHGFDVELDPELPIEAEVFRPRFRRVG